MVMLITVLIIVCIKADNILSPNLDQVLSVPKYFLANLNNVI